MTTRISWLGLGGVLVAAVLLTGCASQPTTEESDDPLEGFNRGFYDLNDSIDKTLVRPVAEVYADHAPKEVRKGVTNFFDNLGTLNTIFNQLLQGKLVEGLSSSGRFVLNTTLGLGGLFNPASAWGLGPHYEDTGQTLGKYGMDEAAYLVLPLIGPNSIRDAPDLVTSAVLNPLWYAASAVTIPLSVLNVINMRANLLEATRIRDEAALDPYVFTREAYRQRRLNAIYDGNPPSQGFEEFIEESEAQDEKLLKIE